MSQLAPLAMIAALNPERVIGAQGTIPWHFPEDMRYFRRMTTGHAVIMGRITFASLRHPLRNRHNLVLTHHPESREDCEMYSSAETILQRARTLDPCPFVIGGAQIYQIFMPWATHLYLTQIDIPIAGDTHFPAWASQEWQLQQEHQTGQLRFQIWVRSPNT